MVVLPVGAPSREVDAAGQPLPSAPLLVGRSSDGKWRCIAHLGFTDRNELVAYRLEVRPWGDEVVGLGTDALRNLPLGRWLTNAHSWLAGPVAEWARDPEKLKHLRQETRRLAESTPPRRGPKGFGEAYYRRLAVEYLELQAKGLSRGIREELAYRETKRQKKEVTVLNIRDALTKATELGYLTKGTRGRAGRGAGPNLIPSVEEEQ